MKRLSTSELRKLEDAGAAGKRAARELRDRRAVDQLGPRQVASLQSVRALIEEMDGDHRAELEVLDVLLAAHGEQPHTQEPEDDPDERPGARPAQARDVTRWPFVD